MIGRSSKVGCSLDYGPMRLSNYGKNWYEARRERGGEGRAWGVTLALSTILDTTLSFSMSHPTTFLSDPPVHRKSSPGTHRQLTEDVCWVLCNTLVLTLSRFTLHRTFIRKMKRSGKKERKTKKEKGTYNWMVLWGGEEVCRVFRQVSNLGGRFRVGVVL